jgi:hypothetical protein
MNPSLLILSATPLHAKRYRHRLSIHENISYFSNALNQLHNHIQIIQVKLSLGPSASLLKCCPVYHHSAGTGAVHSIFLNQVLRFDESDSPGRFSGSVIYYDYFTRLVTLRESRIHGILKEKRLIMAR